MDAVGSVTEGTAGGEVPPYVVNLIDFSTSDAIVDFGNGGRAGPAEKTCRHGKLRGEAAWG